jgi:hypothetical protein
MVIHLRGAARVAAIIGAWMPSAPGKAAGAIIRSSVVSKPPDIPVYAAVQSIVVRGGRAVER